MPAWTRRHTSNLLGLLAALILLGSHGTPALATPWVAPGDSGLRHDLQLLSDNGLLKAPLTSWPLSYSDISANLQTQGKEARLAPHVQSALRRVKARLDQAATGEFRRRLEISGNSEPGLLRSFADKPRSKGELSVSVSGSSDRLAYQLQATAALDPADDRAARLDGSYGSILLGNWTLSAAMVDRWWGPGWDGSLILSSNARPVPSLVLQRNQSTPFDLPVLEWLGPWQFTTFLGQLEHDRYVPDALLFGMRFNFRPTEELEIGLSRAAQLCGEGRPCDLNTFGRMLIGDDNNANQPGNQLSGIDIRWSGHLLQQPGAVYGQFIGEDEAGGLPSKFFGLAGLETWGAWQNSGASWRAYLEYADTAINLFEGQPTFNTAYNHHIYRDGYRYRSASLGHGADNDSRVITLGLLLSDRHDHLWQLTGHLAEFNRDDAGRNTFSPRRQKYRSLELRHQRPFQDGRLTLDVGIYQSRVAPLYASETDASLAAAWQVDF